MTTTIKINIFNLKSKRKGAIRISEIPKEILDSLNNAEIETANLVECLAIDFAKFSVSLFPNLTEENIKKIQSLKNEGWVSRCLKTSEIIFSQFKESSLDILDNHKADMARSFACAIYGNILPCKFSQKLDYIQKFADDNHMSVRECSWLFVRNEGIKNLEEFIEIMQNWSLHKSENVRRFASEATRPRGVWCSHIKTLKENPNLAINILDNLMNDNSKYVQNSVANWLNDASKTSPEFVVNYCSLWENKSHSNNTKYIIKRALRTLNKTKKLKN